MSDPYTGIILAHYTKPVGYGKPTAVLKSATRSNPLCGDEITWYLAEGKQELFFESKGCMIAKASASILAELTRTTPQEKWTALLPLAEEMLKTDRMDFPTSLMALTDLRRFPARARCVLLAWKALGDLLHPSP
jgi:nitrogen fixation NifU-like protein